MYVELSQLFDNRILFCWRISRFDDYLRANRADFSMSNPLIVYSFILINHKNKYPKYPNQSSILTISRKS